jgi:hypothetical protein
MKIISLFALIALSQNAFLIGMNSQDENKLTETEDNCLNWLHKEIERVPCHDKLTLEDQKLCGDPDCYKKNRDAAINSRKKFVLAFYEAIDDYNKKEENEKIELKYDKETMQRAVLKKLQQMHSPIIKKPTNESEARADAFKLLNAEQKSTYSKENYLKNPKATEAAVLAYKENYIRLVMENKLLGDSTEQVVKEKAQQLFEDQMKRFECQYGKPTTN